MTIRSETVGGDKVYMEPGRLAEVLAGLRCNGVTIVLANGCFELLHVGHVRYLAAAKGLGDVLVVAVNTDESMSMVKPGRVPVYPDRERIEIIAALSVVDYVVPLADRTPARLIELLRPHIQAKGTDYTLEQIPERVVLERYGGRVVLVGGPKVRSTTEVRRALGSVPAGCPPEHRGHESP